MANYNIRDELSQETRTRLYSNLPDKPYCTNDFSTGLQIRTKKLAFDRYAYIQLNPPWEVRYLTFDVDWEYAPLAWDYADLPAPTFTTVNPENNHAHLVYELETPVLVGENAREKPLEWMKSIKWAFTEALGADRGYVGLITKNPNHQRWRVLDTSSCYELVVLWESVGAQWVLKQYHQSRKRESEQEFLAEGRNTFLFHNVRFFAYGIVHECETWQELYDRVFACLKNHNKAFFPSHPLPENELRHTAKSLSKWTWKNRNHLTGFSGRHRRKTKDDEELLARQVQSAYHTAEIKRAATEEKIRRAMDKFLREGRRITKAAIAQEVGISRQAIHEYYSPLLEKVST